MYKKEHGRLIADPILFRAPTWMLSVGPIKIQIKLNQINSNIHCSSKINIIKLTEKNFQKNTNN